jgi:hypothetical protein
VTKQKKESHDEVRYCRTPLVGPVRYSNFASLPIPQGLGPEASERPQATRWSEPWNEADLPWKRPMSTLFSVPPTRHLGLVDPLTLVLTYSHIGMQYRDRATSRYDVGWLQRCRRTPPPRNVDDVVSGCVERAVSAERRTRRNADQVPSHGARGNPRRSPARVPERMGPNSRADEGESRSSAFAVSGRRRWETEQCVQCVWRMQRWQSRA